MSKEALDDVAEISRVMTDDDYLPAGVRERCESIIPEVYDVKSRGSGNIFIFKGTLLKCDKSIITNAMKGRTLLKHACNYKNVYTKANSSCNCLRNY